MSGSCFPGTSLARSTNNSILIYRGLLKEINAQLDPNNLPLMIFVNKGIETESKALTLEIIVDECGPEIAKVATFIVSITRPLWPLLSDPNPVIFSSQAHPSRKKVRVDVMKPSYLTDLPHIGVQL